MSLIQWKGIYVLWLREIKKLIRSKSRIIGSLITPLLFLVFLGMGFKSIPIAGMAGGANYLQFLVPGIIGMGLLFSSTFAGLTLIMDREYGFLKEIMVSPVSRFTIVLGRIAGGITTGLIQALLILCISMLFGFKVAGFLPFLMGIVFLMLIATAFIGVGLVFASLMRDPHGFNLIVNFVIFPIFFLSGALYPTANLPAGLRLLTYIDPLTYGVDGLRGSLLGISAMPVMLDFVILLGFSVVMVALAAILFERSEGV
jgi:ABC-2 type transport system permease protein